jgi:hypothetical protein
MPYLYAQVHQRFGQPTWWVVEWRDCRHHLRQVRFTDYGLAHSYRSWHNDWIHKILQTRSDPRYHNW